MTPNQALDLCRHMRTAREQSLVAQNQAHFHVSAAGHDATACLAASLMKTD